MKPIRKIAAFFATGIAAALAMVASGWLATPGMANMAPPPLIKVRFVTDWRAQAEHGGFYQAVARAKHEVNYLC